MACHFHLSYLLLSTLYLAQTRSFLHFLLLFADGFQQERMINAYTNETSRISGWMPSFIWRADYHSMNIMRGG